MTEKNKELTAIIWTQYIQSQKYKLLEKYNKSLTKEDIEFIVEEELLGKDRIMG